MAKKIFTTSFDLSALLSNVGIRLKKIVWFLGRHAFACILVFVIIDVMIGELLFYRAVSLPNQAEDMIAPPVVFNQSSYEQVLQHMQSRKEVFGQIGQVVYSDPFRSQ